MLPHSSESPVKSDSRRSPGFPYALSRGKLLGMKSHYKRLARPLVRDGGALRDATWDEALDRAARGFRETIAAHGAQSFGMFSCSKATNEVNYLAQKFARGVL